MPITYRFFPDLDFDESKGIIREAAALLPSGVEILDQKGWDGFLEHFLGEGQFGAKRYVLRPGKQLYYHFRPLVPRPIINVLKKIHGFQQSNGFPLNWPIEDRLVRFILTIKGLTSSSSSSTSTFASAWPDWPGGSSFSFVLTHDVETEAGVSCVMQLAEIDAQHGFQSSFNFVPEKYRIEAALRRKLETRGFEVGVHGLKHDGKLFLNRKVFDKKARRINEYLKEWNMVGFRSPFAHRNPEWMQALEIEYDSSFSDTEPYETMPGGTMMIWPFRMGRFVELPYTLPIDSTLFITLGQDSINTWKRKLDWITENHGMALMIVHPDYIDFENRSEKPRNGKYPVRFYEEFLECVRSKGNFWNPLPREIARWTRDQINASAPGKYIADDRSQPQPQP